MLSEIEVLYFLLWVLFFSLQYLNLCICKAFGKSYWKHSWWWLPGESIAPKLIRKAYLCDEKNELKETIIRSISIIGSISYCSVSGTGSVLLSPPGPKSNQDDTSQVPPSPGRDSLAPRPVQTSQVTPSCAGMFISVPPALCCRLLGH